MVVVETGFAFLVVIGAAMLLIPPIWSMYQKYLSQFRNKDGS